MSANKYCPDPDSCTYSDCPTAFCDRNAEHSLAPAQCSAATCQWETVSPPSICGKPAEYKDASGKKLCKRHGEYIKNRWPESVTKLEMPPNEKS
jgi:hypothetical protein